jgi:hypothetical protein
MSSKPTPPFNVAADKVVNLIEWKIKSRLLLNAELSAKEKLLTYLIDTPLSTVAGVGIMLKGIFNKKSRAGISVDKKHPTLLGLYTTGAAATQMMKLADKFIFNSKRKAKIYDLCQRGFEQSEDVRAKPVMQRLKAL